MNAKICLTLLVVAAGLLGFTACSSGKSSYWKDPREDAAGSIGDIKRKSGGDTKPASAGSAAARDGNIVLLVAHDAEGRPTMAETRVSSGDPALDRRAQLMVLSKWRFPKGAANTELVTVKAKDVPKAPPKPQ